MPCPNADPLRVARRDLLKAGAVAPVLFGPAARVMASERATAVEAVVLDTRYGDLSAILPSDHLPRHATDGDVTGLWYATLDRAWRKPGLALAGVTGTDALFVLETLAHGRGRRVVARQQVAPRTPALPALVRWTIAPVHPSTIA